MIRTGVGGLAGDVEFLSERDRVWGREEVVLSEQVGGGVVVVVVDAKVNNELVMRGSVL